MAERLTPVKDYALKHKVSVQSIYARIKNNNIQYKKIGNTYLIVDVVPLIEPKSIMKSLDCDRILLPNKYGNELEAVGFDEEMTPVQLSIYLQGSSKIFTHIMQEIAFHIDSQTFDLIGRANIKRGAKSLIESLCINSLGSFNSKYKPHVAEKMIIRSLQLLDLSSCIDMLINHSVLSTSKFKSHQYEIVK